MFTLHYISLYFMNIIDGHDIERFVIGSIDASSDGVAARVHLPHARGRDGRGRRARGPAARAQLARPLA